MSEYTFGSQTTYSRKRFLNYLGAGILSTSSMPLLSNTSTPLNNDHITSLDNVSPILRKHLNDASEQAEPKYYPAGLNTQKRLGYAIVGLGNLALAEVLPAFGACKYSKPVALVSGDPKKAAIVADQYGISTKNIYDYKNFDSIKDNKEIDIVYIILPNSMHHEFTIRAAKAGKHVLCEKPMANSVKECEEMIDACKKANRKLMIAYRIQYEPSNKLMQQWTRNNEYGNVKLVELFNGQHIGDPSQWRLKKSLAGGGALVDVGIYCLNTCRYLLGEEPESVLASSYTPGGDNKFGEVEESVLFQLRFPSGVLANCTTTYGAHACRRYRLYTDKGAWFGMDPAFSYSGLKMEVSQAIGKVEWKQTPSVEEKKQFAVEMDHLSQCVIKDQKPYTPGEEGLQDCKILEAIYKSAAEGRVVKLDKHTELDLYRGDKPEQEE